VPDAEIIQLGSHGPAGRGSRTAPSAAARGLVPPARTGTTRRKSTVAPAGSEDVEPPLAEEPPEAEDLRGPEELPGPDPIADGDRGEPTDPDSGFVPPAVDLAGVLTELGDQLTRVLEWLRTSPADQLRDVADDPLRVLLGVAERLGVDWSTSAEHLAGFVRTRLSGDYAVDEFGFDPQLTAEVFLPVMRWLAQSWFRVEVRGAENIPSSGSALLVSNHAGTLPLDGMILHSLVYDEVGRHVRMLGADLIFKTPYVHDFARKTGTTLACQEDAERLLAREQLVAVYPEGFKGLGKPYRDRYKLQRFGRGGFVSAAVRAQVPIVPVSVVGSEEIYPLLSTAPTLARALGVPYFPVTPTFPWLGVLGLIPLPSKWIIEFGEAITTDELPPGSADDPMVVFNVTDQVRETIQQTLYSLLMQRRSTFF
jgi:1-acyl-sn-glycerol-3-phosphate acyltransferase